MEYEDSYGSPIILSVQDVIGELLFCAPSGFQLLQSRLQASHAANVRARTRAEQPTSILTPVFLLPEFFVGFLNIIRVCL